MINACLYMKYTGLRLALCAVHLLIRKGYINVFNKHSTASRAPSPLHMFLQDYIRTPEYTGHSGLNDVISIGHRRYGKLIGE
jgi:hypothetical protein